MADNIRPDTSINTPTEANASTGCASGCCSSKPAKEAQNIESRTLQLPAPAPEAGHSVCGRAVCGEKNPEGGCCDDSCLDTIAIRECRAECGDKSHRLSRSSSHSSNASSASGKRKTRSIACEYHVTVTRSQYAETLEALGCICRALLARNLETCCSPQPNRSALRQRKPKSVNRASPPPKGSGCCSSGVCSSVPKGVNVERSSSSSVISSKSSCKDGCCGGETAKSKDKIAVKPDAKRSSLASGLGNDATACEDTRCRSSNDGHAVVKKESCGSLKSSTSCDKGCCESEKVAEDTGKKPPSIDRTQGCAGGCCGPKPSQAISPAQAAEIEVPLHSDMPNKSMARKSSCGPDIKREGNCKYGCCDAEEKDRVALAEIGNVELSGSPVIDRDICVDACCQSGKEIPKVAKKSSDVISIQEDSCGGGCCSTTKTIPPTGCSGSGNDDCCKAPSPDKKYDIRKYDRGGEIDEEKGPTDAEHVVLSVSGMTCTGCEVKLSRTLNALSYVRSVKTSLALSRAEFDLCTGAASVEEVVKHIERTTEFSCQVMTLKGAEIHVLPIGSSPRDFVEKQPPPDGVIEMDVVDKGTVRVIFDPDIIGARDLMEKEFRDSANLAPPRPDPSLSAGSKHVRHVGLMTLLSAVLTIPVLVLAWAPLPDHPVAYGAASLALATVIQVVIAGPFYSSALKTLIFSRMIEMDLLIVLSTSAAYIFSLISFAYIVRGRPLETGSFFETSTLLITLIMVGRFLSAMARQKAVESVSITSLQAQTAILFNEEKESTIEREIDARLLQYGDVFKVSPDSSIVTDGTVVSGSSEVDESMITGESMPVEKQPGSRVVAGSTNGSGTLVVKLTRLPGDNTISTIADMVAEARFSKPKIQDLADRVASYFVPVVVALTLVTFAIWMGIGVGVRKQSGSQAATQAITYAIAVLIVSCPCAIGLAVPMVIVMASGVSAENGVIFKTGEVLNQARKVNHIVFDKTGTLTLGKPTVAAEKLLPSKYGEITEEHISSLLLALVNDIKHPVSGAIKEHLIAHGAVPSALVQEIRAVPGQGVSGQLNANTMLRAGNSRWLNCASERAVAELLPQGYTVFCFFIGDHLAAVYGLEDSLRPETAATISELKSRGVQISIVSGDDEASVAKIASVLGIDPHNTRARQKPEDKQEYIKSLLSSNNNDVILFCGDGTNDAAALAQASIGVHMSGGTDVARSAADAVLVRPSLEGLLVLMDMSKDSHRRILFNFSWSFVYNLFAILLAAGAFVKGRIPPEYAGLGEVVSVLPVIIVAAHIRMTKFGRKMTAN